MSDCTSTMTSVIVRDHVHTCVGKHAHDNDDHLCPDCGRRWWKRED